MNRNGIPAIQPQLKALPVIPKDGWVVCPCGGKGLIFQAAFLTKSILVGSKPEIAPVMTIICSKCGEDMEPPFKTLGETKEAS